MRPSTAATTCSTATSAQWRGEIALSIIGNKGNEIGACSCNLRTMAFKLFQYNDQPTMPQTLMLMHQLSVVELLLPSTSLDSEMSRTLRKNASDHITFLSIPRKDFSEVKGLRLIERLSCDATLATVLRSSSSYLAVSAVNAMIMYVEYLRKTSLSPRSILISYECLKNRVGIDRDSCQILELIAGQQEDLPPDGSKRQVKKKNSLLEFVDSTLTQGGLRLLRSNLMMPVNSAKTLSDRFDTVAFLIKNEVFRNELRKVLRKVKDDVDHLLSKFVLSSVGTTTHDAGNTAPDNDESFTTTTIQHVLGLRGLLDIIPEMIDLFERLNVEETAENCYLLKTVLKALQLYREIESVQQKIDSIIDESVRRESKQSNPIIQKTLHVYAVRQGVDSVLDVIRARYAAVLEEVYAFANTLSVDRNIPNLKTKFKAARGFVLQCETGLYHKHKEAGGFLYASVGAKCTTFTVRKLVSLNNKLRDSYSEIIQRTNAQVRLVVDSIRTKMSYFFRISEAVSLLDFVQSLASYCAMRDTCTRPTFGDNKKIRIRAMVHPFYLGKNQPYITNNVDCESANVVLVSGANMTGKTTYLINIVLHFIMAHVGFFVPAKSSELFLMDRVFTRVSLEDSVEHNASTFTVEMRELSYILNNATERSLIVVDELGRGTSHSEGTAIAYAVAEHLAASKACGVAFFATHFQSLHVLASVNKAVRSIHLSASVSGDTLKPLYKVESGDFFATIRYGIVLAKQLGLPEEVVLDAYTLCGIILKNAETPANLSVASFTDKVLFVIMYAAKVFNALKATKDSPNHFAMLLKQIQGDILTFLRANHIPNIKTLLAEIDRSMPEDFHMGMLHKQYRVYDEQAEISTQLAPSMQSPPAPRRAERAGTGGGRDDPWATDNTLLVGLLAGAGMERGRNAPKSVSDQSYNTRQVKKRRLNAPSESSEGLLLLDDAESSTTKARGSKVATSLQTNADTPKEGDSLQLSLDGLDGLDFW